MSLTYSQLVRFPNGPEQKSPTDFSILPDLAEKWTVSKDGKVYTFALRKGVKFHNKPPVNGREVIAEDVKYSLERFMAKSGFATRFEPVSAIEAVDKHTVRITLKEPVRAVPQPPGQPVVLRHPAARGRGEVQGLQPSRRRDRHRAVRARSRTTRACASSSSATPTTS